MDDKTLAEQLRAVAGEHDHLAPYSVRSDVTAGRRRLRRRRTAVGAGLIAVVGVAGGLTATALPGPADTAPPAAAQVTASQTPGKPTTPGQDPGVVATASSPRYAEAVQAIEDATRLHLAPRPQDLLSDDQSITGDNIATPWGRMLPVRINWTIKGQKGEGQLYVEFGDRGAVQGCGTYTGNPAPCTTRQLPNGRPVQVQNAGPDGYSVFYRRPDGQDIVVFAIPHHRNNNPVALNGMPVTVEQLLALVQDDSLKLPAPSTAEAAALAAKPLAESKLRSVGQRHLAAAQGTLGRTDNPPQTFAYDFDWSTPNGAWKKSVRIASSPADVAGECGLHIKATCQTIVLPDGRKVSVARTDSGIEALMTQPGGKAVSSVLVRAGQNSSLTAMGITQAMILQLISDPELYLP